MSVVLLFHFLNVHDDVIHSVLAKVYGYSIVCILLCIHDRRIHKNFFLFFPCCNELFGHMYASMHNTVRKE